MLAEVSKASTDRRSQFPKSTRYRCEVGTLLFLQPVLCWGILS